MKHNKVDISGNSTPPRKQRVCGTCGGNYEAHIKKDGDIKQRYEGHVPAGLPPSGLNRETRRRYGIRN